MKKNSKSLLWIVLLLFAVLLAVINIEIHLQIGQEKEYEKQISLGTKYLQEQDYASAELCYKKALLIQDNRKPAYMGLATAYQAQGKEEKAQEVLKKAEVVLPPDMQIKTVAAKTDETEKEEVKGQEKVPDEEISKSDSLEAESKPPVSKEENAKEPEDSNTEPPAEKPPATEDTEEGCSMGEPWKIAYLPIIKDWTLIKPLAEEANARNDGTVGGQANDFNEISKCDSYELLDLDKNKTPELILYYAGADMCTILTYSMESKSIVYLGTFFRAFLSDEGEIIEEGHFHMGQGVNDFYRFQIKNETTMTKLAGYYDVIGNSGRIEHYKNMDNPVLVSEEEYWRELWKKKMNGRYLAGVVLHKMTDEAYLSEYHSQALTPCMGKNKKWGYVDISGKWKIEPVYEYAGEFGQFSNDAAVVKKENGKKGMINQKGQEIIPVEYDEIQINPWGTVTAVKGKQNTYFKLNGEFVMNPYNQKNAYYADDFYIYEENGKYGITSTYGKVLVPPLYDQIGMPDRGVAPAVKDGKKGFVKYNGEEIPFIYDEVHSFVQGRAAVCLEGKWGYIDENGNELITCQYEAAGDMYGDMAIIKSDGKWGAINSLNVEIIPFGQYEEIMMPSNANNTIAAKQNGNYGVISKTNQETVPFTWDVASCTKTVKNEYVIVKKGEKYALLSNDGKELLPCEYEYINSPVYTYDFGDLFFAVKGESRGYTDINGKWVIQLKE